jgi:hypothetical protein
MIVFDPLAICMVIAYNQLNESKPIDEDNFGNFSDEELADIVMDIQSETPQEPIDSIPMDIEPQEIVIDEEAAKIAAKVEAKKSQDRASYGVKIY